MPAHCAVTQQLSRTQTVEFSILTRLEVAFFVALIAAQACPGTR
jgi:hypothetical protein